MKPNQLLKKSSPRLTEDVLIQQRAVRSMINKKNQTIKFLKGNLIFLLFNENEDGFDVHVKSVYIKQTSDLDKTKT